MRNINKVMLIGNATRDAELRHTSTGKPVASIRLATHRGVAERQAAQYHTVVCWDALAETASRYVKKGDPLFVEGRLEYRTFTDNEGKDRGVVEIIASEVHFLSSRPGEKRPEEPEDTAPSDDDVNIEDIPF
jgi:single-strand DNA-binding protein